MVAAAVSLSRVERLVGEAARSELSRVAGPLSQQLGRDDLLRLAEHLQGKDEYIDQEQRLRLLAARLERAEAGDADHIATSSRMSTDPALGREARKAARPARLSDMDAVQLPVSAPIGFGEVHFPTDVQRAIPLADNTVLIATQRDGETPGGLYHVSVTGRLTQLEDEGICADGVHSMVQAPDGKIYVNVDDDVLVFGSTLEPLATHRGLGGEDHKHMVGLLDGTVILGAPANEDFVFIHPDGSTTSHSVPGGERSGFTLGPDGRAYYTVFPENDDGLTSDGQGSSVESIDSEGNRVPIISLPEGTRLSGASPFFDSHGNFHLSAFKLGNNNFPSGSVLLTQLQGSNFVLENWLGWAEEMTLTPSDEVMFVLPDAAHKGQTLISSIRVSEMGSTTTTRPFLTGAQLMAALPDGQLVFSSGNGRFLSFVSEDLSTVRTVESGPPRKSMHNIDVYTHPKGIFLASGGTPVFFRGNILKPLEMVE
jgi:hypothetical protein